MSGNNDIVTDRMKDLEDILKFTNTVENDVVMILQSLGWSKEGVRTANSLIECPYDDSHRLHFSKLDDHLRKCHSKEIDTGNNNYNEDQHDKLDPQLNVALKTASDTDYHNRDNFHQNFLQDSTRSKNENIIPMTYLEEMALMRDLKRRRSKYKVSTKSKSYTEVIRGVIANQMDFYADWIRDNDDKRSKKSSDHRRISKGSMTIKKYNEPH